MVVSDLGTGVSRPYNGRLQSSAHLGQTGDVVQKVLRVGYTLNKDGLGTVIDGSCERLWRRVGDELGVDAVVLEGHWTVIYLSVSL